MSASNSATGLVRYRKQRITLADAMAAMTAVFDSGFALLASPSEYVVGAVRNGVIAAAVDDLVFDARVFNERAELRWLRDASADEPVGVAVVITEDLALVPQQWTPIETPSETGAVDDCLEYLVWQNGTLSLGTDHALVEGRVRPIALPLRFEAGKRVILRAREYLAFEKSHGNAYVLDERLLTLTLVPLDQILMTYN